MIDRLLDWIVSSRGYLWAAIAGFSCGLVVMDFYKDREHERKAEIEYNRATDVVKELFEIRIDQAMRELEQEADEQAGE